MQTIEKAIGGSEGSASEYTKLLLAELSVIHAPQNEQPKIMLGGGFSNCCRIVRMPMPRRFGFSSRTMWSMWQIKVAGSSQRP